MPWMINPRQLRIKAVRRFYNSIGKDIQNYATNFADVSLESEKLDEFLMKRYEEEIEELFDLETLLKNLKFDLLTYEENAEEPKESVTINEEVITQSNGIKVNRDPNSSRPGPGSNLNSDHSRTIQEHQQGSFSYGEGEKFDRQKYTTPNKAKGNSSKLPSVANKTVWNSPQFSSPSVTKKNLPVFTSVTIDLIKTARVDSSLLNKSNLKQSKVLKR